MYQSLRRTRPIIDGILQPISVQEIHAYCQLTGIELTPFELNTLLEVDFKGRTKYYEQQTERLKKT